MIDDPGGIWVPEKFIALGLNEEVVNAFNKTHLTEPDLPDTRIHNPEGKEIEQLKGVYGLNLLSFICNAVGIQYDGPELHKIRTDPRIRLWSFYRRKLAEHFGVEYSS